MADVLTGVPIGGPGSPGELGAMLPAVFKGGQSILWSPAGRGDVTTFYQALAIVQASKAPTRIYVDQRAGDPPLFVPAGRYEMHGGGFSCSGFGDPSVNAIQCDRAVTFRNLYNIGPTKLIGQNRRTVFIDEGPLLENDSTNPGSSPPIYILREGATLRNNGSDGAMIDIGPAGFAFLGILNSGGVENGDALGSFASLAPGEVFGIATQGSEPNIDTHTVRGGPGSVVGLLHGGNIPAPISAALFTPFFTGTLVNLPSQQDGCSGATAYRPSGVLGPIPSGCMYFDTTLGIPVWWTGPDSGTPNIWVDATGAAA